MASNEEIPREAGNNLEEETNPEQYKELWLTERQQYEELKARYARLAADFDNFRKRTERQSRDLVERANEKLICGLLPILDNFILAIDSVQDESILKGVKMIYGQLIDILEGEGLALIDAAGCPFNPDYHEAIAREESSEHDANIVIEEVRRGYMLGGKVVRPAMVKVNIKKEDLDQDE